MPLSEAHPPEEVSQDPHIFAALYRRHDRTVRRLIHARTGLTGAALDDASQETWMRAWRALPRYRDQASFVTWVCTIAKHFAIDLLRRRRVRQEVSMTYEPEEGGPDAVMDFPSQDAGPHDVYALRQVVHRASAALEEAPDILRDALLLDIERDGTRAAVAQSLGIPKNTLKSRIRYARERIIDEVFSDDEDLAA